MGDLRLPRRFKALCKYSAKAIAIIAREMLRIVRENATIDSTVRESVRPNLRRLVKRLLRKYGYPPDKQEIATQTVIQQAELMAKDWAE
ncbi:MAG: DUF3387 domain-containing protein [Anaerolineales bacterium]|nr:DUF3387 domain-containing protein [Anaerolineales bacterium]